MSCTMRLCKYSAPASKGIRSDTCTFMSAELDRFRHGPHALGVASLDFKVVRRVKGQLLDLVGESVPHHRLNHPVMYLGIDFSAVVDNVAWGTEETRNRLRRRIACTKREVRR